LGTNSSTGTNTAPNGANPNATNGDQPILVRNDGVKGDSVKGDAAPPATPSKENESIPIKGTPQTTVTPPTTTSE